MPHAEDDFLIACLQEHKIGVLVRNFDKEPLMILQVEYNSARAKKKPFNQGDVLFFKVLGSIFAERLSKFAI